MGFAHVRALIAVALSFVAIAVSAHEIGTTRVDVVFRPDHTYIIDVATNTLTLLNRLERVAGKPRSNGLTPAQTVQQLELLKPQLVDAFEIHFDGKRAAPHLLIGNAGLHFTGDLPAGAKTFSWRYALASGSYALTVDGARQWLDADATSVPFPLSAEVIAPTRLAIIRQYLILGYTHILPGGLDHILFVLGMFLLTARAREVLAQVTAFTIAHSITLGLTMYGVVSVSPRIVEPAIALSIAYIAIENVVTSHVRPWRVAIVFCFGLLHGMGFAGVLRELGLPRSEFLPALVSFNIGVEAGQLTVIAAAFVLFAYWWQRKPWYRQRFVVPASMLIGAIGLFWTVQRVMS